MAITVTSASNNGNVTCPTTAAGDLILFINIRGLNQTEAYPSGFTGFPAAYQYYSGTTYTQAVSYKIADGTEGGTSIAGGLGGAASQRNYVFVINDSGGAFTGANMLGFQVQNTSGNPSGITITSSSMVVPGTVFGVYNCTGAITTRSMTSSDGEVQVGAATTSYVKYKSYTSSPANQTIDTGDNGDNTIFGFWIEKLIITNAVLAVTEAADTAAATAKRTTHAVSSIAEAADTAAATAKRTTHAVSSIAEAADTVTAIVLPTRQGVLAVTEAADTVAAVAQRTTHATVFLVEEADNVVASVLLGRMGVVSVAEDDDTLAMTGYTYIIPGWHPYERGSVETWRTAVTQAEDWTPATKQTETWTARTPAA